MRNHAERAFVQSKYRMLEQKYAGGTALPFFLTGAGAGSPRSIPVCGVPLQFEVLFCLSGRLAVQTSKGAPYVVEAREIFLLSDSSELHSCQYSGNLSGILVAVDAKAAKESLMTACSALGMELNTKVVQGRWRQAAGAWRCTVHPGHRRFLKRCVSCLRKHRSVTVFSNQ